MFLQTPGHNSRTARAKNLARPGKKSSPRNRFAHIANTMKNRYIFRQWCKTVFWRLAGYVNIRLPCGYGFSWWDSACCLPSLFWRMFP